MDPHSLIKRPLVTEKLTRAKDQFNRYAFEVDLHANKLEIKQAIEKLFKVKVLKVFTVTMPGKARRFGARTTAKLPWKKAIATLKKGDRVEIFEGV